jgi:hypothetical protein
MKNKQKSRPQQRPRSVQHLTGSPGPTIDAFGKMWRLGFADQNAKGQLEELIRSAVVRRENATAQSMGADGDAYWDKRVQPKLDEGYYTTFRPGWLSVMKTEAGVMMFLQSLLMKHHPDVTTAFAKELFTEEHRQVIAAIEVIAPDFFVAVAIQMGVSPEAARERGPAIAAAVREQFAELTATLDQTTPQEPGSESTT